MELSEIIKSRRSVRRFKPEPVPRDIINNILELAQWAPSVMNWQDWRFLVVEGETKKALLKITATAFEQFKPFLEENFSGKPKVIEAQKHFFETYGNAPVIVLAYGGHFSDGKEDPYSVSLAVQNLLLACHAAGLGAVWADGPVLFKEKEINELMEVEGRKLVCLIPIGYPAESPKSAPRKEGRVIWKS